MVWGACGQSLQLLAVAEVERLEAPQLSEPFGQCHQLGPQEIQCCSILEQMVLHDTLWKPGHCLAALHEVFIWELKPDEALRQ